MTQEAALRGQRWSKPLALALGLALVVAARGDDADPETSSTTEAPSGSSSGSASGPETTEGGEAEGDFSVCQVTDTGGVDDDSFNQSAFEGMEAAAEEGGFESSVLESSSEADFEPNIQAHIDNGCDLILTIGFLLGDATATAAEANPDVNFASIDDSLDAELLVVGAPFLVDQRVTVKSRGNQLLS